MDEEPSIEELMARLRSGDEDAATEVFHRFRARLVRLAQTRLDADLRRKVEPEDVVQSAFFSFFRRQRNGSIDVDDWDNLWTLLAVITVHKCGHQIRYYRAGRRNTRKEQSAFRFSEDSAASWEAVAQEPTPSHAMQFTESLRQLFHSLDERECQIVLHSLQGISTDGISKEMKCSQRTVRRVLERVRSLLEKQCDDAQ